MSLSPFIIPIVAIIMVGLFPVIRAYARQLEARARYAPTAPEVTARLERIERAVEAVAIEVERISEGQRFTTKLLSEANRVGELKIAAPAEQSVRTT